jgi:hypothetical protein
MHGCYLRRISRADATVAASPNGFYQLGLELRMRTTNELVLFIAHRCAEAHMSAFRWISDLGPMT